MSRMLSRYLWIVCMHGAWLAAQQTGSLAGKVSGAGGQALHGAIVTLSETDTGVKLSNASTGVDGAYRLSGIANGRYRLAAAMAGYKGSATETITLTGELVAVDFSLQPDGIVGNGSDRLDLRASGVEGSTAPSGYSAGASAEESAAVVTRVSRMDESGLSLQPSTAKTMECNREGDLIDAARSHPGALTPITSSALSISNTTISSKAFRISNEPRRLNRRRSITTAGWRSPISEPINPLGDKTLPPNWRARSRPS